MAALTWTTLQTALLAITVKAQPPYNVVPPDFAYLYPQATSYAEGRIYKDIPFLATRPVQDRTHTPPYRHAARSHAPTSPAGPRSGAGRRSRFVA